MHQFRAVGGIHHDGGWDGCGGGSGILGEKTNIRDGVDVPYMQTYNKRLPGKFLLFVGGTAFSGEKVRGRWSQARRAGTTGTDRLACCELLRGLDERLLRGL